MSAVSTDVPAVQELFVVPQLPLIGVLDLVAVQLALVPLELPKHVQFTDCHSPGNRGTIISQIVPGCCNEPVAQNVREP